MAAMIRFYCRKCAQRIKVQEAFAGRVVRCPKCGELQPSPSAQSEAPPQPEPSEDFEPMGGFDGDDASEPAFPIDEDSSETSVDREVAGELSELAAAAGLDGPAGESVPDQPSHLPAVDEDEMDSAMAPPPRKPGKAGKRDRRAASQSGETSRSQSVVRARRRRQKKKNRVFLIAAIILVVLMIGAFVAVIVMFAANKQGFNAATPTEQTTEQEQAAPETPDASTPDTPETDADTSPDPATNDEAAPGDADADGASLGPDDVVTPNIPGNVVPPQ